MLANEKKIPLREAVKLIPGNPHKTAPWRWGRHGVRARNGEVVYLELARYGGRLFTSAEALGRFAEKLAAADREGFDAPAADLRDIPRGNPSKKPDVAADRAEAERLGVV